MKTIETGRLPLRKFTEDDFSAAQSYASCKDNVIYMVWGPNSEEHTRAFINMAITRTEEIPCVNYQYAVVLKTTGTLIGACNIALTGDAAEIGWILHCDYWKQGYGTEMGAALLDFGFGDLNLHRIVAHCDAENIASYRVMEKIGMRREGLFIEGRMANKSSDSKYGDELSYAILKDEWETQKEIKYYNTMPFRFNGFIDVPELSDGVIHLVCTAKKPGDSETKIVPGYEFAVCVGSEKVGDIRLRIGYTDSLYFAGQIGYDTNEQYRGKGYAGRACLLVIPVAKAHGMEKLLITNNHNNAASRRVCEKLGARFVRVARIPEWFPTYNNGIRFQNIYEWSVD